MSELFSPYDIELWQVGGAGEVGGLTFHHIFGSGGHRGGQWEPREQGLGQSRPLLRAVPGRGEEILPAVLRLPRLHSGEICRVSLSLGKQREGD